MPNHYNPTKAMRKFLLLTIAVCAAWMVQAQEVKDTMGDGDTARAAQIIDNYLSMIDYSRLLVDSTLRITTYIIDRDHPTDTMTMYRWYGPNNQIRIEMWQDGKIADGYYSDGGKPYHKFDSQRRVWRDITHESFLDRAIVMDPRGALHNWRSKGAEVRYVGTLAYEGHKVDRIFVACPNLFDRNYLFEQETGLLFMVTEENHIYGDAKPSVRAQLTDWRAWHEFIPFGTCLLPSVESYQSDGHIVLLYHHYRFEPYRAQLFIEDYHKINP